MIYIPIWDIQPRQNVCKPNDILVLIPNIMKAYNLILWDPQRALNKHYTVLPQIMLLRGHFQTSTISIIIFFKYIK